MKLARYVGGGRIEIQDEDPPACPEGGLLVKTIASGLCSGELMDWYMDRKIPHVLGHEVCGRVLESRDERFPVGSQVFVHHHAPCLKCEFCLQLQYVHCEQWKRTKLHPGGMAEMFAVMPENLNDTLLVNDLRPIDAALIEPLGCVMKSLNIAKPEGQECSVIGLGSMGLLHMLMLDSGAIGYDLSERRRTWALSIGLEAREPSNASPATAIYVCPGSPPAVDLAIQMSRPGGTVLLFAPMPPDRPACVDLNAAYFKDLTLKHSYSCGPDHTRMARAAIHLGKLRAEQVVSDFIGIGELPEAYQAMKRGDILKAMVIFE